jgi:GT2 family glycosyltransferase
VAQQKICPSKRQAILVLGMHRSGTSALSGVASILSASAPLNLAAPNIFNPHGYWESQPLMDANNELLASAGSSWDDWRQFNGEWYQSEEARGFCDRIKQVLAGEYGDQPLFVIKDPRICRLVPFYVSLLKEMDVEPSVLFAIRNPLEVAQSLQARDGFSLSRSMALWLRNVLDAEFCSRNLPRCFIAYHDLLANWHSRMERAAEKIGVIWPADAEISSAEIERFLTPDLHRQRTGPEDLEKHRDIPLFVREVQHALVEMSRNERCNERRDQLDRMRGLFNESCDRFDTIREGSASEALSAVLVQDADRRAGYLTDVGQLRLGLSGAQEKQQQLEIQSSAQQAQLEQLQVRLATEREERNALRVQLVREREKTRVADEKMSFQSLVLESKDGELGKLRADIGAANAAAASLKETLDQITESTTWQASLPIRVVGAKLPSLRRAVRRSLGIVHWVSRYRLSGRHSSAASGDIHHLQSNDTADRAGPIEQDFAAAEPYDIWVRDFDTLSDADRSKIRAHIDRLDHKPTISIVMPVFETPEHVLRSAIDSVRKQHYPNWELCIADDASTAPHVKKILNGYSKLDHRIKCVFRKANGNISAASNSALAIAQGDYVALLDHDDELAEHALYMVVTAIDQNPGAEIFYSDEDKLDSRGRRFDPYFKPDWNPELFLGQNFLNHLTVYKRSAIERVGGFREGYEGSQDYDLGLRIVASTAGPIVHIPFILYHWRIFEGAKTVSSMHLGTATARARYALVENFAQKGVLVTIGNVNGFHHHRVVRPDPSPWPKVSVVIPTRDHLEVLATAVDGVLRKTDYPDLELLIADNESNEPETLAYFRILEEKGVKFIECPGPFNFSDINNKAVSRSTGELILLLNNDVAIIEPDWLSEMVRYFDDPMVGVVGAKLLYPDGTLQHGGVVIGIGGVAGHRYVGFPGSDPGNFGRLALSQDVSCVTGACILIRRSVYEEVGGLDATHLAVAFNDVDFCMKVREAGHRIIWTPFAVLYHHESKSRGLDLEGENRLRFEREVNWMLEKWGSRLLRDPFFNPNLSLESTNCLLASPPRTTKPWEPN